MKVIALATAAAVVVEPGSSDWDRTPGQAELTWYHPVAARQASMNGAATVRCAIAEGGGLSDCAVVSEAPEGWGFGEAALGLARWYRLSGPSRDKVVASGGGLEIPMAFRLATSPESSTDAAEKPRWIRGIDRSRWLRSVTGIDMARVYPEGAQRSNVEGVGAMDCVIGADGRLWPCSLVSEQPPRAGFGLATLRLAAAFQLDPHYVREANAEGGVVRIPIRFRLPKR